MVEGSDANARSRAEERKRQWEQRLARQRRSGLSIRAFCEQEGISEPSFYSWRRRLQASGTGEEARRSGQASATLLPVQVGGHRGAEPGTSQMELELAGGRTLRFSVDTDPQVVRRMLEAVEAAQC